MMQIETIKSGASITLGSVTSARATASIRCSPPES
jgi:hypothetical protein